MTPNLTLVLVASVLVGTGAYLFLSRSLVRALMGFLLMGNGVNLVFIIGSGPAGSPPIVGAGDGGPMADPVPQALVLTAIVITLAMTAFVLALAHRGWQLARDDLVSDDTESARIHARAEADDLGPGADQAHDVEVDVDEPSGEGSP
ncbi:MAG: Na(+)/H(+) antiporter subunit C [Arsenicicoccus sp.]|nr:MAG: Na(+)/H(+) antiporter subunit C [Arsenicicoccus sp.]